MSVSEAVEVVLPSAGEGGSWLVMLYQDAGDQILEKDIYIDLNEVEKVGSSERVYIVSQVDRYQAAYQGDDNWTSARRYYLTPMMTWTASIPKWCRTWERSIWRTARHWSI